MGASAFEMEDVSPGDWFYRYVMRGLDFGLITGTSGDSFRFAPNRPVTRAEFVTMLGRLHEHWEGGSIDSRPDGTFYGRYLAWAVEHGIVQGNQHGDLMLRALITREQMAVMLYRYIDVFELQGHVQRLPISDEGFNDSQDISNWARREVRRVVFWHGFMEGMREQSNLVFRPQANSSRAEALAVLVRLGEPLVQLPLCSGCGDIRSLRTPLLDANFVDNNVLVGLTRCATRADKDWLGEGFNNIIEGVLYVSDLKQISEREYVYIRRVWDAERDAHALNTPEAWQAFEIAAREAEENTRTNWRTYRRVMVIHLEQNCRENVISVIRQLQQYEFILYAEPNYIMDWISG